MDWSVAEVVQRQALFSTALVRQFMKKLRKYQNLMLKNKVNITDSGYGSSLHTSKSFDDDIELVLQENSTSADYCKSFWSFGARVSVFRLFQWVYRIVQRTKAARILCHLDAVPENDIEATVIEVAKELSVAFEYQLMMLYSDVEVIKLADHAVCCLLTYLNTCESEFTCASLLQAILEIRPLTGNKKEIVRTREVTHKGTSYCLCWKLWQILKQPGLRLQPHHIQQENNREVADNQQISNDFQTQPSSSMEVHLLPGSSHKDITNDDDSSRNVEDAFDQGNLDKKETYSYNHSENSTVNLRTRLLNVNTDGKHNGTVSINSTDMMEVLDSVPWIESIAIPEAAVNIKQDQSEHISPREKDLEALSWNKSIEITSYNEENSSGFQNENENIKSDECTSELTSETTGLENGEIDEADSAVGTQQTTVLACNPINMTLTNKHVDIEYDNKDTHAQEEETSINCSADIKYWTDTKVTNENEYETKEDIKENKDAIFFKKTEDTTNPIPNTAEDTTVTAPIYAQKIKENNFGLFNETKQNDNATLEEESPSIVKDVYEKDSLDNVHKIIENNYPFRKDHNNMANIFETQSFSDEKCVYENHDTDLSSKAETLTDKKSQEGSSDNGKIDIVWNDSESSKQHLKKHDEAEVQGSQGAIDEFTDSDKSSEMYKETNGSFKTACEIRTLALDLSSDNFSGNFDMPYSFGHARTIDSHTSIGSDAYGTSYGPCSSNQVCGAYMYKSDENIPDTNKDLVQTHTVNISDGNRLMENVFPSLVDKTVEHETFLPSTNGTFNNPNQLYTNIVPEFENTCNFESLSPEEGKRSTITEPENIISNIEVVSEYENSLQSLDLKAEHKTTLSSVDTKSNKLENVTPVHENSMVEKGISVTEHENVSTFFEHKETPGRTSEVLNYNTHANEDISESQLKQELASCSREDISREEVSYKFYGCFTSYGAKCRPHVYGFRGPLHIWNEKEAQVTLVFNDTVTTVNSRARQIPFTKTDIHQSYIPKTRCKH